MITQVLDVKLESTFGVFPANRMTTTVIEEDRIVRHTGIPMSFDEIRFLKDIFIVDSDINNFFESKLRKSNGVEITPEQIIGEHSGNSEMEIRVRHLLRDKKIDQLLC